MLNDNVFYNGIIRKTIVAFGSLFSNIYIDRKVGATGIDSVNGSTIQRLQVPIAYGPKEKWVVRLEQDPTLENHTYVTLPRMSFEINTYNYDFTRKLNKMNKIVCNTAGSSGLSNTMFTPVPYNIGISLYIVTKTQEDGLQIIEQILPTFGPEYVLTINAIPNMFLQQNIPVVLNNVTVSDDYDKAFQTRRFVIHTLTFTLKVNLFGSMQTNKPIFSTFSNLSLTDPNVSEESIAATHYSAGATGTYQIIRDEWIEDL